MSRIRREEVENLAQLARLSLDEAEVEHLTADLDRILEFAASLQALDTEGIEPMVHVMPLPAPAREDRAEPPLEPECALRNAPERDGTAFVVPVVIAGDEEG